MNDDAIHEEWKLEKELPGNEFVHDKRAMHEGTLMNEFMEGFKNSDECNGITFYLKTDKKPAFTVQIAMRRRCGLGVPAPRPASVSRPSSSRSFQSSVLATGIL